MPLSDCALDMIATRLSAFTDPDIPPLELRDEKTLQNNMLESIFGVFSDKENVRVRHLMTNLVTRVFYSAEAYTRGRENVLDYVAGDRHGRISPYFFALMYFETCVSYSWQAADLVREVTKIDIFPGPDGSGWQRLHAIYTEGIKHSSGRYEAMARPEEMPTAVWLTNSGIACVNGTSITFRELAEAIAANNELFYDVQARVRERYPAAAADGGAAGGT